MKTDMPTPYLADLIEVRQSGLRSINIERDADHTAVALAYTLTPQVRSTLGRILNRLESQESRAQAWTLTGPYGAGKSYFSLFLMNLLGGRLPAHTAALRQLKAIDEPLAQQIHSYGRLDDTYGFLPIPMTGYRTTLPECLQQGLVRGLQPHLQNPRVAEWVAEAKANMATADSRTIVNHLQALTDIVCDLGYQGLLLVMDEMGKPLEYLANHPHSSDIYLLQELAELADRSAVPLIFIGILHQGFERYASHLDLTTRREWDKVQGRFADVPFQEPAHQQMGLLAQAIVIKEETAELMAAQHALAEQAAESLASGWRPPLISDQDFLALCQRAYPLHPTALVTLPHLFRRLAQNERSLFSYLGSLEPFGFQAFLRTEKLGAMIRLPDLFDYLTTNFQGQLYGKMTGRLITETLERLHGATNLSPLATAVLKTVGLLNWVAEVTDLIPTKGALIAALHSTTVNPAAIQDALDELGQKSLVTFRRFNQSYVVWQGSDVDLDERLEAAEKKLRGVVRLAQTVEAHLPPRPIVPRRHSYETGFMRFWQMRYLDTPQAVPPATAEYAGTVLLALPQTRADHQAFLAWATDRNQWAEAPHVAIGLAQETERLGQLTQELRSLHWIQDNTPALRDDPVARRELRTRIQAIEALIRSEIETTLSPQQLAKGVGCRWFYRGEEQTAAFGRGLSAWLSTLSDALFERSPRLRNELINRRNLTSQGAAARRNLIEAMLLKAGKQGLGIEGYPPERSMYESVLLASGLHRPSKAGVWGFFAPPEGAEDKLSLRPVWQALEAWVFGAVPEQRSLQALYDELTQAPYGLTEGVLPVLLCAFMQANPHEMTLYREGTLLPMPTVADWEVLLRRPELFALVGVRMAQAHEAIVVRMAKSLGTEPLILPVVRDLIRRVKTLPEFAWHTQHLSEEAVAVRRAFEQANVAERLLFHDLPTAVKLSPFSAETPATTEEITEFFNRLNQALLQELAEVLPKTIANARDQFLMACNLEMGHNGWEAFRREAAVLLPYVNHPRLLPLLKRAAETADSAVALESVLALIANRPPRSWRDGDVARFGAQAEQMAELLRQAQGEYDPLGALAEEQRQVGEQMAADLQVYLGQQGVQDTAVQRAALRVVLMQLEERFSANGNTD